MRPGVPLGRGCPGRHRIGAAAHAATYTQRSILYAYIDGGMYACMYVCGYCRALNGRCLRISLVFLLYLHLCMHVCMYIAYLQDEHQVENAVVQKFQSFLKKILSFAHTYIHAAGPAAHPAVLRQNAR